MPKKITDLYNLIMTDYRCVSCGKLLFRGKLRDYYHIETVCPRCKMLNTYARECKDLQKEKRNIII